MRKLVALLVCLYALPLAAQESPIFYWVDKKGNVSATQNIDEVPEPYRAMYQARLKELEEAKKKQPAAPVAREPSPTPTAPPPSPQNSIVEREMARQKQWKDEVAKWRLELRLATEDVQKAQADVDAAAFNPVLRQTPQGQAKLQEPNERKQAALARIERARHMLQEELPKRAKAENVPPAWLL